MRQLLAGLSPEVKKWKTFLNFGGLHIMHMHFTHWGSYTHTHTIYINSCNRKRWKISIHARIKVLKLCMQNWLLNFCNVLESKLIANLDLLNIKTFWSIHDLNKKGVRLLNTIKLNLILKFIKNPFLFKGACNEKNYHYWMVYVTYKWTWRSPGS